MFIEYYLYDHYLKFQFWFVLLCVGHASFLIDEPYMAQGDKNLFLNLRSVLRKMSIYPSLAAASMSPSHVVDDGWTLFSVLFIPLVTIVSIALNKRFQLYYLEQSDLRMI